MNLTPLTTEYKKIGASVVVKEYFVPSKNFLGDDIGFSEISYSLYNYKFTGLYFDVYFKYNIFDSNGIFLKFNNNSFYVTIDGFYLKNETSEYKLNLDFGINSIILNSDELIFDTNDIQVIFTKVAGNIKETIVLKETAQSKLIEDAKIYEYLDGNLVIKYQLNYFGFYYDFNKQQFVSTDNLFLNFIDSVRVFNKEEQFDLVTYQDAKQFYYGIRATDILLKKAPFYFDPTVNLNVSTINYGVYQTGYNGNKWLTTTELYTGGQKIYQTDPCGGSVYVGSDYYHMYLRLNNTFPSRPQLITIYLKGNSVYKGRSTKVFTQAITVGTTDLSTVTGNTYANCEAYNLETNYLIFDLTEILSTEYDNIINNGILILSNSDVGKTTLDVVGSYIEYIYNVEKTYLYNETYNNNFGHFQSILPTSLYTLGADKVTLNTISTETTITYPVNSFSKFTVLYFETDNINVITPVNPNAAINTQFTAHPVRVGCSKITITISNTYSKLTANNNTTVNIAQQLNSATISYFRAYYYAPVIHAPQEPKLFAYNNKIYFSFKDTNNAESSYEIYTSVNNSSFTLNKSLNYTTLAQGEYAETELNLVPNYGDYIQAYVSLTLEGITKTSPTVSLLYCPPLNLQINGNILSWQSAFSGATYKIYVNDTLIGTTTNTTYPLSLQPDTIYKVTVKPSNQYGDGEGETIYFRTKSLPNFGDFFVEPLNYKTINLYTKGTATMEIMNTKTMNDLNNKPLKNLIRSIF